jgi:hypothetical protein
MNRCKYPDCFQAAEATFALVPLCELHNDTNRTETVVYYNRRGRPGEPGREHYAKIKHLIPWSRKHEAAAD